MSVKFGLLYEDKNRMGLFENSVLRRIFGLKRKKL